MFRKLLRKLIPTYAILPLAMTGLANLIAYSGVKLLQLLPGFPSTDLTGVVDGYFPFQPAWVLMYIGTFLFWFFQYTTVARESPAMAYRLAAGDFVAKMICMLFFIFLPTTNVRPEVTGDGFIPFLMRFIYWIDTPTNLFPSIHCFVAWMGTHYMFLTKKVRCKPLVCILCVIGSLMVFASTLFTKQHVFWDVIGGVVVAEIGFFAAKFTRLPNVVEKLNEKFMKTRLCQLM